MHYVIHNIFDKNIHAGICIISNADRSRNTHILFCQWMRTNKQRRTTSTYLNGTNVCWLALEEPYLKKCVLGHSCILVCYPLTINREHNYKNIFFLEIAVKTEGLCAFNIEGKNQMDRPVVRVNPSWPKVHSTAFLVISDCDLTTPEIS